MSVEPASSSDVPISFNRYLLSDLIGIRLLPCTLGCKAIIMMHMKLSALFQHCILIPGESVAASSLADKT